jgi:pantetheine-phosphate adenylyltransferase
MTTWVYPGSFDPVTLGHLDIIRRAAGLCDKLIVAVLNNSAKQPVFSMEERMALLSRSTGGIINVEIGKFEGLLAEYTLSLGAVAIVRGLRAVSDFELEFQIATMNRKLAPTVETVFIMTSTEYSFVSSTIVKEVGRYGGDISSLVPPEIHDQVKNALVTRRP